MVLKFKIENKISLIMPYITVMVSDFGSIRDASLISGASTYVLITHFSLTSFSVRLFPYSRGFSEIEENEFLNS